MNPKIAHRGEQNGSFLKNLNSYRISKSLWDILYDHSVVLNVLYNTISAKRQQNNFEHNQGERETPDGICKGLT